MKGLDWCRELHRSHPRAMDVAVAVMAYACALLASTLDKTGVQHTLPAPLTVATSVLGAVVCGALIFRRRWPVPVLAFTVAGVVVCIALAEGMVSFVAAPVIAAFTVGTTATRVVAYAGGGAAAVALAGSAALLSDRPWPEHVGAFAWVGLATCAGDAVRSKRAHLAAMEARALQAEQTREEEARRRVVEERMRIAQELHDVVAHHIALINVQAGVAGHTLRDRPAVAEEALAHIRRASRAVLDELTVLLGVLRQSGDPAAPTEPAPSFERLHRLVDSFTSAGLTVDWSTIGQARPLPAPVDLAAFRVVQESLTNVHKHGGGAAASLHVTYTPAELIINVRNDHDAADRKGGDRDGNGHGTGHGILGMRERVTAVGGRLTVGPAPDGGFQVNATLPLSLEPSGDRY